MGMERRGLVAYVEAQIERDIALGRIHPSGRFGSEAKLARRYEVCRGTIREALRRLAARGLVVQRSGRKTRAVPLDESLTLENLGLALHDASNPDARWLLEGYFSLKRQALVELLADCCASASDLDLDRLGSTCYRLQDAARWESGEVCARAEFELLRHAARVAARPGHVLLVQSLQRAFLGGAAQLLPLMGGGALHEWAIRVMEILNERDVQALQHELPALLKARDERALNAFAPTPQVPASPGAHLTQEGIVGAPASANGLEEPPAARPCVEKRCASAPASATTQAEALDACPCIKVRGVESVASAAEQDDAPEARPCGGSPGTSAPTPTIEPAETLEICPSVDAHGLCCLTPIAEDTGPLGIAPCLDAQALLVEADSVQWVASSAPELAPCEAGGEQAGRDEVCAAWGNLADRQRCFGASPPEGVSSSPRLDPLIPAESSAGRVATWAKRFMDPWASLGRWTVCFWRSMAHSTSPPAS
ncbi:GntR family transcriptional regulator [Corallococcus exiguus]|nr:GntR family transcriptional regulator [Corallococcus exiguus]NNB97665.1 GntR family transcriptional regulator [Corallococcus exiguus]NNC06680.1 GntR family transcriptional regulator [Corallococcus exiguus]